MITAVGSEREPVAQRVPVPDRPQDVVSAGSGLPTSDPSRAGSGLCNGLRPLITVSDHEPREHASATATRVLGYTEPGRSADVSRWGTRASKEVSVDILQNGAGTRDRSSARRWPPCVSTSQPVLAPALSAGLRLASSLR